MGKYQYIHFSDNIPKNIEREYNKLCRKEQYLEERDSAHGVIHIEYDAFLNNIPEPCVRRVQNLKPFGMKDGNAFRLHSIS